MSHSRPPLPRFLYQFKPVHVLLGLVPLSIVVSAAVGPGVATFLLSILALIPVSVLMGEATEQLSLHLGPMPGGLLNATFGNAAELAIGFLGLRAGLLPMVRASITGSIIGNMLLVLGMGALAGGLREKEQEFGRPTGSLMSTLMLLAVIGLVAPAVFASTWHGTPSETSRSQHLSAAVATVLLVTYALGLLFTLKTHQSLFTQQESIDSPAPSWSLFQGLTTLCFCALLVFVESEIVVGSVSTAAIRLGLTQTFIGVILVAIAGNAAEHATAVWMAYQGRMDICVNVSVGSSAQIALLVAPLLVLTSMGLPHPLSLIFSPMELTSVILAVAIAHFVGLDGKTNWFEGVELLAVYLILAAAFFYLPA